MFKKNSKWTSSRLSGNLSLENLYWDLIDRRETAESIQLMDLNAAEVLNIV